MKPWPVLALSVVVCLLGVVAPAVADDAVVTVAEPAADTRAPEPWPARPEEILSVTAQPTACVRRDAGGRFAGWIDYKHCVVSGRTTASARWLDDLFGDWHDDEATLRLRVIAELGKDEESVLKGNLRVRGVADLPNAFTRLRLVLSDDESDGATTNGDNPAAPVLGRFRDNAALALRWVPFSGLGFKTDVDLGLRSTPEVYARWRLRQQWQLGQDQLLRLGQTFRYGYESQGVSISQLEAERAFDANSTLRIGTVWRAEEAETAVGFQWSHGLSLQHMVGSDGSLSYGWAVAGLTRPHYRRESHGPWLVWRQSLWREWLFYEIEPRITYYRRLGFEDVASLVVRLEVQFGQ